MIEIMIILTNRTYKNSRDVPIKNTLYDNSFNENNCKWTQKGDNCQ